MAQVVAHQDEFDKLYTNIVTISFTDESYWAETWLRETNSPFPLLLDPTRTAYHAYGLDYSLMRAWNGRTIFYYIRALLSGRKWRGIQGDSGQLGGDYVVDTGGIVRLVYPSHDPTDRPSVDHLLSELT
ncbi:MAG: redoxin domain-containing protein [Chloroflexi bacterium]|nr:redoxin domain-containing protein [Chloroflexota bacterium]